MGTQCDGPLHATPEMEQVAAAPATEIDWPLCLTSVSLLSHPQSLFFFIRRATDYCRRSVVSSIDFQRTVFAPRRCILNAPLLHSHEQFPFTSNYRRLQVSQSPVHCALSSTFDHCRRDGIPRRSYTVARTQRGSSKVCNLGEVNADNRSHW
jgi:hypothetical protein